ncbi:MAG: ATP-binding protein [Candidatus Omnitrophota bacterium]
MRVKQTISFYLTFRYILALGLLSILSLGSYFILKENIKDQKNSAAIVNISGRQRMLSQRIALFSLRLLSAGDPLEKETRAGELREAISLMEDSHNSLIRSAAFKPRPLGRGKVTPLSVSILSKPRSLDRGVEGLIKGDVEMNSSRKLSSGMKKIYFLPPFELDKKVRRYLEEAKALILSLDGAVTIDNPRLHYILEASRLELLRALDEAVGQYQLESEKRIVSFEALQFLVLGISLLVIIASGLFIFRPMAGRIAEETLKLKNQSLDLAKSNEQLKKEISERWELEERLRAAITINETLLKTIPFGIDIVDEEGNILYQNEKMEGFFGEGALGKKCYLLYKDDKKQCLNCPLKSEIQFGQTKEIEVDAAMGGKIFLITHTGMFYQGKKAVLEMFEDVTDYKRTQERLAMSERLAGIGRMAGAIAHEFRNQLGVIRNSAYFLKLKLEAKDEKIKRHLEILDEQVVETEAVIENILTFSKTKHPELRQVNLKDVILKSLSKLKMPEGIKLSLEVIADDFTVEVDPLQMGGIFVNIILNAIQAMDDNGSLLIKVEKINNYATIIFTDTGAGIKEEDQKKLFEPFFSTKARGIGLGLATAKLIIEAHHGSIAVKSDYGKGTSVIIKLPL